MSAADIIIPAAAGFFVIELADDGVTVCKLDVLAWRIRSGPGGAVAEPVCVECVREASAILGPSGQVHLPGLGHALSVEEWRHDELEARRRDQELERPVMPCNTSRLQ